MDLRQCYSAAGADYDEAVKRFKNEKRVARFLRIFLRDQSFIMLCEAMAEEDYSRAFDMVHAMKGICMGLGLTDLTQACIGLTENLRPRKADSDTRGYYKAVRDNYEKTAKAICSHLDQDNIGV